MADKPKDRNSNIELLRIISMAMIIILHYLNGMMGGALYETKISEINFHVANLIETLSIPGVNIFILIIGYFSVKKQQLELVN